MCVYTFIVYIYDHVCMLLYLYHMCGMYTSIGILYVIIVELFTIYIYIYIYIYLHININISITIYHLGDYANRYMYLLLVNMLKLPRTGRYQGPGGCLLPCDARIHCIM